MDPKIGGRGWKHVVLFLAGVLVGVVSAVEIVPKAHLAGTSAAGQEFVAAGDAPVDAAAPVESGGGGGGKSTDATSTATDGTVASGGTPTAASTGSGGSGGGGVPPSRKGLECAPGKNGGATDEGVTGTEIKLATTTVDSGPGAAFLRDVRYAMQAVTNKVNAAGGICGRKLVVEYRDDGWNAQTGAQYLRNFIQQGVFAIPVGPSSEGLRVVIDSGDIDRSRTAVVGADGLLIDQYQKPDGGAQPWVWPVATATVASARIMVQEAFKRGARNFSIVFDRNYRFGREGALAFNSEVRRVTGQSVTGFNESFTCDRSYCGIDAGKSSYSEAARFEPGDFVALFLDPITALAWMRDPNTPAASTIQYGYGAAQPLFTRGFAVNCKDKCDQMTVWTGFKPPIESHANDPAVKQYVSDLKRTKPDADEFNAFAQGGYIGMLLLVEALREVGPDLTRERLKGVLDRMSLSSGLTLQQGIRFSPSSRYANTTMQGFVIQHKGTFGGWREGPTLSDPRPTAGIG